MDNLNIKMLISIRHDLEKLNEALKLVKECRLGHYVEKTNIVYEIEKNLEVLQCERDFNLGRIQNKLVS